MSPEEASLMAGADHRRHIAFDPPEPDELEQMWLRLKGVAARRGEVRRPADLEAARAVMADVARDPVLLDRLAAECLRWSPSSAAR